MTGFIALSRGRNLALIIGMLLVSFGLVGCGGQLGKIEISTVDTAIADASTALEAAHEVDAATLASELFESAEANLDAARAAREAKNGDDALRLAYQAIADATHARTHALNITKSSELNATILQKKTETESLREAVAEKKEALAGLQSEMADVRRDGKKLRQKVQELQEQNRELSDTRAAYGAQVAELSDTLEDIQGRAQRAEIEIRNYGKEVSALRRKLEVADQMAREEGYQKRAVIAEIDSLKRQLREQAQIYTDKLAAANQQNAGTKHAEYLKQKAQEARAYVDSQPPLQPLKTGRTSLSTQQIAAGKAALQNWERAWQGRNMNEHLAYYEPHLIADKVVMRESKEHRTKIDLQQLKTDIHEMSTHTWNKVKTDIEVEGESVIGVQRLTRLAAPAADENATELYDIWIREVWMHPAGNDWRIHHEIWQIYENVPNF